MEGCVSVPAASTATAEGVSEEYCTTADASSQLVSCRELYTVPSSRAMRSALLALPLRGRCSTLGTLYRAREVTVTWAPLSAVSGMEAVAGTGAEAEAEAEAAAPKVAVIRAVPAASPAKSAPSPLPLTLTTDGASLAKELCAVTVRAAPVLSVATTCGLARW